MNEVEYELNLLKSFAESKLKKGSFVYEKVEDLITQARREQTRFMQNKHKSESESSKFVRLMIRINSPVVTEPKTIQVPIGCTMEALRTAIVTSTGPNIVPDRIVVRRIGKAWGQFDQRTIDQCDIKPGDELIVDVKNVSDNANVKGLERIAVSGINAINPTQTISLALHSFMLDMEFLSVVEIPSTVPGFAPSLKELPKTMFIPTNWDRDATMVGLMYKHKLRMGKQFQLTCVDMDESVMVTFSQRGGESQSMELALSHYTAAEGHALANAETLQTSLLDLIQKILPELKPTSAAVPTGEGGSQQKGPSGQQTVPPPPLFGGDAGMTGMGGRGGAGMGVGGADMDPFYGGVHIGGGPATGGRVGGGEGGGNLIGPNNPMFYPPDYGDPNGGGYGGDFSGGLGGIGGLPQPRFDPFGPVLGPNQDIGGAGAGNVGVDGRGRRIIDPLSTGRGGRGRGGRGYGNFPGEPNPDHMKPPGW